MMKFMMMSQMMGGGTVNPNTGAVNMTNNMLPMFMMMNGGMGSMFDGMLDGMFDFADTTPEDEDDEIVEEDEE
jgi:hypothetical protein